MFLHISGPISNTNVFLGLRDNVSKKTPFHPQYISHINFAWDNPGSVGLGEVVFCLD